MKCVLLVLALLSFGQLSCCWRKHHRWKHTLQAAAQQGWPHHHAAQQHTPSSTNEQHRCPDGCEENGNCNRALGLCECPIGYTGPNCSTPLWPSCKIAPKQREVYCSNDWRPKSCACLQECAAFVCPDGTHKSCERDFDLYTAKCFQRPANYSVTADGLTWDGGSDLPDELEQGVKYYKGWLHPPVKQEITREVLTEVGIIDDIDMDHELVALPIGSCPLRCKGHGACVRRKNEFRPFCSCHYGFQGEFCHEPEERTDYQRVCWNNCQGRGSCRRGYCHCQKGWWGKDCSSSQVYAPYSARRPVHKLRVYVYDLPWQVSYQPEYQLGWRNHDQNYMAWKVFGETFMNDTTVRTQNPWEANMFYIPAMSYAFSENTGDSVRHSKRAIDYVRQHWPFFNRSQGLDHFIWLTGDRGACPWPAEEDPALANIIKVVHFGWHHPSIKLGEFTGWEGQIRNQHWGCFHPIRDISAAAYWLGQADEAKATYLDNRFDVNHVPQDRLIFFAGSIRPNSTDYSHGVRQQLWELFGRNTTPQVLIHDGRMDPDQYAHVLQTSRYCLAPSGYGWGIRLNQYMARGCVPVIIQDDVYQPWEDLLPYSEFSVRLPKSSIPHLVELLSDISDEDYLQLRAGLAKHWRPFIWDSNMGGQAYDYMIKSLRERMLHLNARHYHPLRPRPVQERTAQPNATGHQAPALSSSSSSNGGIAAASQM